MRPSRCRIRNEGCVLRGPPGSSKSGRPEGVGARSRQEIFDSLSLLPGVRLIRAFPAADSRAITGRTDHIRGQAGIVSDTRPIRARTSSSVANNDEIIAFPIMNIVRTIDREYPGFQAELDLERGAWSGLDAPVNLCGICGHHVFARRQAELRPPRLTAKPAEGAARNRIDPAPACPGLPVRPSKNRHRLRRMGRPDARYAALRRPGLPRKSANFRK
jgi:hypothetical protein